MSFGITRRALLCSIPLALAAQPQQTQPRKPRLLPAVGEFSRVVDPVTENTIVRLTTLASSSVIPLSRNRFVSARERSLIFSSDRTGHFAPHQIDLRTGMIKQIAETVKLNPRSLSFDRSEKAIRYLDDNSLFEAALGHGTPKKLADACSAFGNAADGSLFFLSGGRLIHQAGSRELPLADQVNDLWPQPNAMGCLFARTTAPDERDLYYVRTDGKPALLASGRIREPYWDADGESILFLRDVTAPSGAILAEIHGRSIHGGSETLISPTSQFACFALNSNATVFVGASRSRAQPNVVLTLRSPHREMTLCEHHSSHPGEVSPAFSPDNRRVYFESDREGHSAIYSVNVELLVEPNGSPVAPTAD